MPDSRAAVELTGTDIRRICIAVVDRYWDWFRGYHWVDKEDVVQEACIRAIRMMPKYDPAMSAPSHWIWRVVKFRLLDLRRVFARLKRMEDREGDPVKVRERKSDGQVGECRGCSYVHRRLVKGRGRCPRCGGHSFVVAPTHSKKTRQYVQSILRIGPIVVTTEPNRRPAEETEPVRAGAVGVSD